MANFHRGTSGRSPDNPSGRRYARSLFGSVIQRGSILGAPGPLFHSFHVTAVMADGHLAKYALLVEASATLLMFP